MNDWKETTLGEVVKIKNGKSRPENGSAYPVYGGNGILGYADDFNVEDETVVVGRVGAYCGSVFLEKNKFWLSDNALGIESNKNSDIRFLYYLLKNLDLNKKAIGGAQPLLTQGILNQIGILLPLLEEQKEIAGVLGSLDDKIELLREENKTLEATAQAIFKEWFVNFNFPADSASRDRAGKPIAEGKPYQSSGGKMIDSELGKIPEGWRVGKLGDICLKLASGGTPLTKEVSYYNGSINWFSTKELQDNFLFQSEKKITQAGLENSATKVFPKGSIVMAIYAAPTVGRLGILAVDSTFNQAACGFVADGSVACNEFIYLLLLENRSNLNGLSNGAAQQNLSVGLVRKFPIVIPERIVMMSFKDVSGKLFQKILNNSSEIQTLSTLRDTLLPKLMSGDLKFEK